MEEVHNDFGTIPMEELIDYAIELALPEGQTLEVGGGTDVLEGKRVDVTQILHNRLEAAAYRMPIYDERFDISHLYPGEQAILPGQELVQPQLAETLGIIRDYGAAGFYNPGLQGSIGQALVEEIPEFEPEDFTMYEVDETEPIHGEFAGYDVYSAPAPMSGITLIQILQLVEAMADHGVDITQFEPDSPEFINMIIAATRQAYKERNDLVGDPRYVDVPIDEMTSKAYADEVAEFMVNDEQSYFNRGSQIDTDPVEMEGAWGDYMTSRTDGLERDHKLDTTHFVVVDKDGTMVSATNTLSNFFGSGYYVGGFFLNDQLSNFAADNPASPNYPEPGKRSRSFISPTIITNEEGQTL
jgi:gamma-glutamyltranspeptidase / glutathione hydrolase